MEKTETLDLFYQDKLHQRMQDLSQDEVDFNLFRYDDCARSPIAYRRRDYFKVTYITGDFLIHYGDMTLSVSGPTLAFFHPDIPYSIESLGDTATGYFFIFKEAYFNAFYRAGINSLPLFASGHKPVYSLDPAQDAVVGALIGRMKEEMASDYAYKHDLIRSYLVELVHTAAKLQSVQTPYPYVDANARITMVFRELLDRQFPIESTDQRFELRSARDYADRLGVHVNHLNRALKLTTGKTTTEHIFDRLASEAQALLKHTQWNVSQIGYTLGFDDTAHFNHFFKKQTHQQPSYFRQ